MAGFHFSHVSVFKIRGGMVVDEIRTLHLRLSMQMRCLIWRPLFIWWWKQLEVFYTSPLPSPPLLSLVIEVRDGPSSPPSVVGDRDGSPSLPLETFTSPPVDAQHQDKGKEIAIDEGEKVASKRGLKWGDVVADSRKIKKSRMTLIQETSNLDPASYITA
ncbi:hypothetical protein Fot_37899 [Forsythia ovata]|uniref:Uncharacterized protein n=1 Tax=Forsythia ovata TaxID=205694 RepID=A0ABD1S0A2_9LAMI